MGLRDPSNCYISFLETLIILTVEEVLDDISIGNKLAMILHPFDHIQVFEKSFEMRDDGRICECFPRTSMAVFVCFLAVWVSSLYVD